MKVVIKDLEIKNDYCEITPGMYVVKVTESNFEDIEKIPIGKILKVIGSKNKMLYFANRPDYIGYLAEDFKPVLICVESVEGSTVKIITPDLYLIDLDKIPYEIDARIIITTRSFSDLGCEISYKESPHIPIGKITAFTNDGFMVSDMYESKIDYLTATELLKKYTEYKGKSNQIEKAKLHENVILREIIKKAKRENKSTININEIEELLNNR